MLLCFVSCIPLINNLEEPDLLVRFMFVTNVIAPSTVMASSTDFTHLDKCIFALEAGIDDVVLLRNEIILRLTTHYSIFVICAFVLRRLRSNETYNSVIHS